MYLAYLDDSDTKSKTNRWQVFSAVILKDEDFGFIEQEMGSIAENLVPSDKLSAFEEFHASELYGGHGVFEGIDESKRIDAISAFA